MSNPFDEFHATQEAKPLPLVHFYDITVVLDVQDFVQGMLMEGSSAVIYGESNSGKTFWATDLALHVAAGIEWNGRRVEQGGVLYLALEGGHGFRNRVAAWKEAHDAIETPVYFVAIPSQVNLLDPEADIQRVIDAAATAAKEMGIPIKLIIVDTLARAMAGGNENAPDDMGALITNTDTIREATGALVAYIHHSGKNQALGARGHSSLRAAVDTEIEVEASDGPNRTATVVKQRDMKKGDVFTFTLEVVELGENRHGEAVTTCLVKPLEAGAQDRKATKVEGNPRRALDALHDVLAASGATGVAGVPPNCPSVPEDWWRERFYARTIGDGKDITQNGKRMAFNRAVETLQEKRIVGVNGGRCWAI